jgi:hypothetical protein
MNMKEKAGPINLSLSARNLLKIFARMCSMEDALQKDKVVAFLPLTLIFLAIICFNTKSLQYANVKETFMVFCFSTPLVVSIAVYLFSG